VHKERAIYGVRHSSWGSGGFHRVEACRSGSSSSANRGAAFPALSRNSPGLVSEAEIAQGADYQY
jgi:hypothetical protein